MCATTGRAAIAALLLAGCCACASVRGASTLVGGIPASPSGGPAAQQATSAGSPTEQDLQINPDRPDFTDAAYTVPAGLVQIESGWQHTRIVTAGQSSATPLTVRVGMTHWFEARLDTDGLIRSKQYDLTSTEFGGLTVGGKFRLWAPSGGAPVIAVEPGVTLPWGRGGGGTDCVLTVITGGDLPRGWHLDVNYSVGSIASGNSHAFQQSASASASVSVGQRLNPYAETYWTSALPSDAGSSLIIDAGAIYTLNYRMALDGGATFAVRGPANGPAVFAGFSIIVGGAGGHRDVRARMRDAYTRGDR